MSQNTPMQTPSRSRRPFAVETPGSARSTTSTTDRSTLVDRVEDLELEVHDLRRQINAERERRRISAQRRKERSSSSGSASLALSYIDPTGRGVGEVKEKLMERLRKMDDDALTALLTGTNQSIARLIAEKGESGRGVDGEPKVLLVMDAGMVPSKSVGVEGTGSGSDIDRRLRDSSKSRGGKEGTVEHQLSQHRHDASVNQWLKDRQRRTTALLDSLVQFSHLDIHTLEQTDPAFSSRSGEGPRPRHIHMAGHAAPLFPIDIEFDVIEEERSSSTPSSLAATAQSPQIRNLHITLPNWLASTLNVPHNLYTKLLKRNDLPAILLMLRTMIPLLSLRRNLFTSLMETYTDLVRDHIRAWESTTGVDFAPYHPSTSLSQKRMPSSQGSNRIDESLARSLIVPEQAETLVLKNKNSASLSLRFEIRWNRYGHAYPEISISPTVPSRLTDATGQAFLTGFNDEFQHLLKVSIAQDGIVGFPDHDPEQDDDLDPSVGRFGILPPIHATIKAFFSLDNDESLNESSLERD